MFDDDVRDTEPTASPEGRLRAAVLLLGVDDVALLAELAERLAENRREAVRAFDAPVGRMTGPGRVLAVSD